MSEITTVDQVMLSEEFNAEAVNSQIFQLQDPRNSMMFDLAALIHEEKWLEAGCFYAAFVRRSRDANFANPTKKSEVEEIVTQLLHWCLNNDRYSLAARLLWSENLFDARPHFTQMIWSEIKQSASIMLMGSASASKSYSTGVWLLLDWLRDPAETSVLLLGPSEEHLNQHLFTHLINLHQSSSIKLPGEIGDRWIGLDRRNKFGAIKGVVVPLGRKSAGRLQGAKKGRRKKPHPIFGAERRLRVFLDESEKIPAGIWKDIDNIFSNLSGTESFKIMCAFNPENQNGESGTRCEPTGGWIEFNLDTWERWRSKRGWSVVRLDGFRGENITYRKTVYPGLQTIEGIERLIENAGGYNSGGYYTMARAAFPPSNADLVVIPQGMADAAKGTFIFATSTTPCGSCDTALEGGDAAPFGYGEYGLASGYRLMPSAAHPQGEVVEFRNAEGDRILRPALQVMQIFKLDKGDTVFMAKQIQGLCLKLSIKPEWYMMDRTGNGAGVHDILKTNWSSGAGGVNSMESAGESKILEEDSTSAKEAYGRVLEELWFATRKFLEHRLLLISPMIDTTKLFPQLTGRQYRPGKLDRVESKPVYRARNAGQSPDEADTFTLLVHAARKGSNSTPSLKVTKGVGDSLADRNNNRVFHRIDVTNRLYDDLDDQ